MAFLNLTLTEFVKWEYPIRSMHIHEIVKFNINKNSKMGISEVSVLMELLNLTFIKIAKWGYPVRGSVHGIA